MDESDGVSLSPLSLENQTTNTRYPRSHLYCHIIVTGELLDDYELNVDSQEFLYDQVQADITEITDKYRLKSTYRISMKYWDAQFDRSVRCNDQPAFDKAFAKVLASQVPGSACW